MIKKHVTIEWIKELIRSGDTSPFYNTEEWGNLRELKRKNGHWECERCRARGEYKRGVVVHHKKYLKQFPELALVYNNLELLCDECHYEEHHKNQPQKNLLTPERW